MAVIRYKDYKHFEYNEFKNKLISELSWNNVKSENATQFRNISKMALEK